MSSLESVIELNDGVKIPNFGLGLYLLESGSAAELSLLYALKIGYKLLDTAQFYQNEADVGRAIKKSGVDRKSICVVSKVWDTNHGYEATVKSVKNSLSLFQLDYVDIFLIHSPVSGSNVETYKALLDLKKEGLIKSVGVSNFGIQHLKGLEEAGLPTPSINQIELHPFCKREKLVNYCREKGICVMGYCPIARGKCFNDPDLINIAKEHNKSVAQVMIRWSLDKGFVTIPKSSNTKRIQENMEVFDFKLTEENHRILAGKPDNSVVSRDPTTLPWEG
ncbi:hypothetical protein HELRODRAFT_167463 [Helobdella robusta]|uniref:NADP-dependent oxidoreductase domain-containing protein n=1 Tax=Helobdella robusta TaxID=6412 RepID=T1EZE6_HELRO|nr:hypothetical protein HELRODRAFT_167463 [Helobdella robusta]ESO10949.1 hypothetical protein HELRODRAFT_167463 [Helobdella robusta]